MVEKRREGFRQILLELVDIWHFGLSSIISQQRNIELATENIYKLWNESRSNDEFYISVEKISINCIDKKRIFSFCL